MHTHILAMKKHYFALLCFIAILMITCKKDDDPQVDDNNNNNPIDTTSLPSDTLDNDSTDVYQAPMGTKVIPSSPQRSGDPQTGYDYLVSGDYIGAGVPYDAYLLAYGQDASNPLGREAPNDVVLHEFTAVTAPNGVLVVAPNCLQCHASKLNGELIVGLGNSFFDSTNDQSELVPTLDAGINLLYGAGSPEDEAYQPFRAAVEATGPKIITQSVGANPADQLAAVLAAHRDPNTLEWIDEAQIDVPDYVVQTDVPPWWVLKKKNAMFYGGFGRGDFSRYIMASSLLTMENKEKAEEVDEKFPDVLAYLNSIEAPIFPGPIDEEKALAGESIFNANCSSCHGTYGEDEFYPNLLVEQERVGTDPFLDQAYTSVQYSYFINWFNNGWFGTPPNAAQLVNEGGYVAQPLDGIWASAPYLHNGSIPTLEALLNSSVRPTYWRRSMDDSDLDLTHVGWNYTEEAGQTDKQTYNTTLLGYGNMGHTFGDHLSDEERSKLIEYMKTL